MKDQKANATLTKLHLKKTGWEMAALLHLQTP